MSNYTFKSDLTADKFIKSGGTSKEILLADGTTKSLDDLDNLQIGGRNLLKNSSKYTASTPYVFSGKGTDIICSDKALSVHLENGGQYTISAQTDGTWSSLHLTDGTADPAKKLVALWITDGRNYFFQGFRNGNSKSFTFTGDTGDYYIRFNGYSDGTTTITVKVWNVKIEFGNKPTDWTPAPEDLHININSGKFPLLLKGDNIGEGYYDSGVTLNTSTNTIEGANISGYVKLTGDTMTGNLNITNSLSNPALGIGSSTITYNKTTGCLEITA